MPGNYMPMKMEETEWSETSAYKIQTSGNYPEESIQHSEHGESLKSRILFSCNTTSCGHGEDIFVEVEIRKFEYKDVQAAEQFFLLICTKHRCQHYNCSKQFDCAVHLYLTCTYFLMSLSVFLILTLFFKNAVVTNT